MKIRLAQINPIVGNLESNTHLIISTIKSSAEYDIIVFPELQESVTVNDTARKIIENELKRVAELSNDALNKYEVIINVNSYLKKVGFDITF